MGADLKSVPAILCSRVQDRRGIWCQGDDHSATPCASELRASSTRIFGDPNDLVQRWRRDSDGTKQPMVFVPGLAHGFPVALFQGGDGGINESSYLFQVGFESRAVCGDLCHP